MACLLAASQAILADGKTTGGLSFRSLGPTVRMPPSVWRAFRTNYLFGYVIGSARASETLLTAEEVWASSHP